MGGKDGFAKSELTPIVPLDSDLGARLREKLPDHLFEHSTLRSLVHLFVDLAEVVLAFGLLYYSQTYVQNVWLCALAWVVFIVWSGITWTGLWVLAHEAGHGGFSQFSIVNDIVGFTLHTMLYVPYGAWQLSHAKHHSYTNHVEKDDVFIPVIAKSRKAALKANSGGAIQTAISMFILLTIGWPLYLMFNASGPPKEDENEVVSHYDPHASIFKGKPRWRQWLSNVLLVAWTFVVGYGVSVFGWWFMARMYLFPLMIVNMFLVTITFLQHTDPELPHYGDSQWRPLRGSLGTIDRSMGSYMDYKLHHIVDSHVVHHIWSAMPFFNAKAATPIVKRELGKYYVVCKDRTFLGFVKALWTNMRVCCSGFSDEGIIHFITEEMD